MCDVDPHHSRCWRRPAKCRPRSTPAPRRFRDCQLLGSTRLYTRPVPASAGAELGTTGSPRDLGPAGRRIPHEVSSPRWVDAPGKLPHRRERTVRGHGVPTTGGISLTGGGPSEPRKAGRQGRRDHRHARPRASSAAEARRQGSTFPRNPSAAGPGPEAIAKPGSVAAAGPAAEAHATSRGGHRALPDETLATVGQACARHPAPPADEEERAAMEASASSHGGIRRRVDEIVGTGDAER